MSQYPKPTQEQVEAAMRARINTGQEVPAEYEHLKQFGYNPSQARGKDGKWTAEQVANAPANAHSTALKGLKGKEHSDEYGAHALLAQGKKLLGEGKRAEAEHVLIGAAHAASKTSGKEAFRQGLNELADKHGLHQLGAYTGSIGNKYVPAAMSHTKAPTGIYDMPTAAQVGKTAKNQSLYTTHAPTRKAYEGAHRAAEELYFAHNALGAGNKAQAAKHVAAAHKILHNHPILDPKTGEMPQGVHPHAKALIDYLHQSLGYHQSQV